MSVHQSASSNIPISLYPIVIQQSRYGGIYEGGAWHAMANCEITEQWNKEYLEYCYGGDEDAVIFWDSPSARLIGVGDTPDLALADLLRKFTPTYPY